MDNKTECEILNQGVANEIISLNFCIGGNGDMFQRNVTTN